LASAAAAAAAARQEQEHELQGQQHQLGNNTLDTQVVRVINGCEDIASIHKEVENLL